MARPRPVPPSPEANGVKRRGWSCSGTPGPSSCITSSTVPSLRARPARLEGLERVRGHVLHCAAHRVLVSADGQSARALDVQHRCRLLQRRRQALAHHLERAGEIDDLIDAFLPLARARELGEPVAGPGHVFADAADQLVAGAGVLLFGEFFDEQGQVVKRVLDVVRHRCRDHPDRLAAFRSRQPLRQDLRSRALGLVQLSRALGVEQRPREQHARQRRSNPVDEHYYPAPHAFLQPGCGEDVVQAGQQQADEEPDDDEGRRAAFATHAHSVPEEMSHLSCKTVGHFGIGAPACTVEGEATRREAS